MSILETLMNQIDEHVLIEEIDAPLDQCFESFTIDPHDSLTHGEFNAGITAFYQHINRHRLANSRRLSSKAAFCEVLWIIEKHYKGHETRGYDGALFDASSQGQEGLMLTVERILQIMKSLERKNYVSWMITSTIDPSDWHGRKKLVEDLMKSYRHLLHPDVKKLTSSQLTPHLEELIFMIAQPLLP